MSDLSLLEQELMSELLRNITYIDIDRDSLFECKADISSGFLNDLDEYVTKIP